MDFVYSFPQQGKSLYVSRLAFLWGLVFNLQGGEADKMSSLLLLRKEAVK